MQCATLLAAPEVARLLTMRRSLPMVARTEPLSIAQTKPFVVGA